MPELYVEKFTRTFLRGKGGVTRRTTRCVWRNNENNLYEKCNNLFISWNFEGVQTINTYNVGRNLYNGVFTCLCMFLSLLKGNLNVST